ncbi:hypothetical protein ABDJ41_21370 [Pedobacter sp. ASV1-7]|uniref:hypothetical protein n=1 Tax=Pedobacter sp. ASV1-7 TaxID=3145237 RepID=UPI0032E92BC8
MKEINFNPADFETVRQIALLFPGAQDSLSHYNTPSIKIKKHLLCRLHENGESLIIRTNFQNRELFLEKYPESCFINEHLKNYSYIGLYINSYTIELLKAVLECGFKAITEKEPTTRNS